MQSLFTVRKLAKILSPIFSLLIFTLVINRETLLKVCPGSCLVVCMVCSRTPCCLFPHAGISSPGIPGLCSCIRYHKRRLWVLHSHQYSVLLEVPATEVVKQGVDHMPCNWCFVQQARQPLASVVQRCPCPLESLQIGCRLSGVPVLSARLMPRDRCIGHLAHLSAW